MRDNQLLLSVVIPVYNNTQHELTRCFNSILNQTVDNYEVIVVDDGSCHTCASFLDTFSLTNSKFKIFHQQNSGVSTARNNGVKLCQGKYITFVDADDVITSHFFSDVYSILSRSILSIDIIYGYVLYLSKDEIRTLPSKMSANNPLFKVETLDDTKLDELYIHMIDLSKSYFRQDSSYVSRGSVAKVVKKSLFMQVPFQKDISQGEDTLWNLQLLLKKPLCVYAHSLWYLYVENYNSASKKYNEEKVIEFEKFLRALWPLTESDESKVSFLRKTIEGIWQWTRAYCTSSDSHKNLNINTEKEPWNLAFKWKYAIHLDLKNMVKFLLIQLRLEKIIFPFIIKYKHFYKRTGRG